MATRNEFEDLQSIVLRVLKDHLESKDVTVGGIAAAITLLKNNGIVVRADDADGIKELQALLSSRRRDQKVVLPDPLAGLQ